MSFYLSEIMYEEMEHKLYVKVKIFNQPHLLKTQSDTSMP